MHRPFGLFLRKNYFLYQVPMLPLLFLFSKILPAFSPSQTDRSLVVLGVTSGSSYLQQVFMEGVLGVHHSPRPLGDTDPVSAPWQGVSPRGPAAMADY